MCGPSRPALYSKQSLQVELAATGRPPDPKPLLNTEFQFMTPKPNIQDRSRRLALRSLPLTGLLLMDNAVAVAGDSTGTFGLVAEVETDGFFTPRLKSVRIQSVVPGLPAAAAGIAAGDLVVEVDGRVVMGAGASDMANLMKKAPGQKLGLKLRRPRGDVYAVELTAVQRP
jgi:membrane-associated protease RseP (regulator of RpoE activity)